ncbi:hypothetical protein EVAR_19632_1 [Eumeta japonica]|uniref:Uncharacterized protein n=1 Tax=Eumeta variegata TaxID=151549 RepID=A0A4C1UG73_EUMVA|nr:hypothetical protein EVAR_19632_1 [Eumeta japonica]
MLDAFGIQIHDLVESVARIHSLHHLGSQSPFLLRAIERCEEVRPPSLCCVIDPCTAEGPRSGPPPVRMSNVTALWFEDVTPRTTCHSSALSSRAELHAVTPTAL